MPAASFVNVVAAAAGLSASITARPSDQTIALPSVAKTRAAGSWRSTCG